MTLGELITALVDMDLQDPTAHDTQVGYEVEPVGPGWHLWLVVGSRRVEVGHSE